MKPLLFVIPLKPGKLAEYERFAAAITGPRKREYADLLKRYGLKTAKVWHSKIADKGYIVICHDAEDDAPARLKNWSASKHPFDLWFNEQIMDCYDAANLESVPPPEFLFEFKTQKDLEA